MARSNELYVISGIGRDVTGLVSLVTSIISDTNGNIIDLEERVFHGLFSILLTVDLSEANITGPQFVAKMQAVAHQSGLHIIAERHRLMHRLRGKRMLRLALLGPDQPGIVSAVTFVLANNGINIERAHMISRGELFAMEMELDRGVSSVHLGKVEENVSKEMKKFNMRCFFQADDIYNKTKRLLIFNSGQNMLEAELYNELLAGAVKQKAGVSALKGMKLETVARIANGLGLSSETEDLLHTLKLMGFRICLIVDGFDLFLKPLQEHVGIDHILSNRLLSANGVLTGEMEEHVGDVAQRQKLVADIVNGEKIKKADIITIGDSKQTDICLNDCGIRFVLDREGIRDLLSSKSIKPEQIPAFLSAFGPVRSD